MNQKSITKLFLIQLLIISFILLSCSTESPLDNSSKSIKDTESIIYMSIVMHNEEPKSKIYPDFTTNESAYWEHHSVILKFVTVLKKYNLPFNFQSDWNFLQAMLMYDHGTEQTNQKNLLRYMYEDLGVEIDPHAHEFEYNYADVAYLIEELGIPPSKIVGGYIAYPESESKLHYFDDGVYGDVYDYFWQPEYLWGAGTSLHKNEKVVYGSGIWYPKSSAEFIVNDPSKSTLPNIGHFGSNAWFGLNELLDLQSSNQLSSQQMYTHYQTIGQIKLLEENFIEDFEDSLQEYLVFQDAKKIEFVGLNEMVIIWQKKFDSNPSVLAYAELK